MRPMSIRYRNVSVTGGHEHCQYCCGYEPGLVVVQTRVDQKLLRVAFKNAEGELRQENKADGLTEPVEEFGPCPACEMGYRIENGISCKRDNDGRIVDAEWKEPGATLPWGPLGFWQGRPWDALAFSCRCQEKPMHAAEAREALAQTRALVLGGIAA